MATATVTRTRTRTSKARPADVCRLVVVIRGEDYTARPIACDAGPAWRLRKADGTVHDVADALYGTECTCGDFVFHHDGRDAVGCKHVRALRALGLLNPVWPTIPRRES